MSNQTMNPLLCDIETGVCEIGDVKAVTITYFTDPICSSCWGVEPQLRKLKLEYGDYFDIDYRMGGLLPSWEVYNSGGISKPSDVAAHWDEVSEHYEMPIDGDVWLLDPLASSYPPSVAFKAVQKQNPSLAVRYLRALRELVFVQKTNIARADVLKGVALDLGANVEQFENDMEGEALQLFKADLELAKQQGVRGFPTFISKADKAPIKLVGVRSYESFEQLILQHVPGAQKNILDFNTRTIFDVYSSLTAKEFAVLFNTTLGEAKSKLHDLTEAKVVTEVTSKNGSLWLKN